MGINDELVDDDELAQLLMEAENDELSDIPAKPIILKDDDTFSKDIAASLKLNTQANDSVMTVVASVSTSTTNIPINAFSDKLNKSLQKGAEKSIIHSNADALDSSDDEDVSNFLERKYNEYGRDVKTVMKKQNEEKLDRKISNEVDKSLRTPKEHIFPVYQPNQPNVKVTTVPVPLEQQNNIGIYTDPIFGIRIVHPLISSTSMKERMVGRIAVTVSNLKNHLAHADASQDWAIAGVIVQKGPMLTSKKGQQYTIWKLSDLKNDIKTVSIFLFKGACKDLWKTAQGMVVAILNPNRMDKTNDEACLSVDNSQKFMILGQSKDLGTCKSKKKNGEPCTATVNKNVCEYCIYHVKQEYGKMSTRVELQSATSGRGLQSLRNKILGKSEVFYGGQSYSAIPAKKNQKLIAKDEKRLLTLSQYYQSPPQGSGPTSSGTSKLPTSKIASNIETNVYQRQKDLDRLKKLSEQGISSSSTQISSDTAVTQTITNGLPNAVTKLKTNFDTPEQFKNREFSMAQKPILKKEGFSFDLSVSLKQSEFSKTKALEVLKKKPIPKSNPNFIKHRGTEQGKKRANDELQMKDPINIKKQKLTQEAERFQKERIAAIINKKSSHTDLIDAHQNESQEKYFDKLEKKEAMEDKMLSTFKMNCKAVVCLKCRYTAFTAAEHCKEERHPIKVIDAEKRFFECRDCGNRTATVHRMPQMSCKNCQSSRWQRTAMIKDRKDTSVGEKLSIRGDEESFLGTLKSNGNLNLCVAEE